MKSKSNNESEPGAVSRSQEDSAEIVEGHENEHVAANLAAAKELGAMLARLSSVTLSGLQDRY